MVNVQIGLSGPSSIAPVPSPVNVKSLNVVSVIGGTVRYEPVPATVCHGSKKWIVTGLPPLGPEALALPENWIEPEIGTALVC